jgi:hypothetical protein
MTTETKKLDPRDAILMLLLGLVLVPVSGVLRALTFRLLWGWFMATQYGDGPTLQTWFGINVLVSLMTYNATPSSESEKPLARLFKIFINGLLLLGVVILSAAMARFMWGWR